MPLERPDLSHLDPAIRNYIESLEAELEQLRQGSDSPVEPALASAPSEPPTTWNVITLSASGMIKRSLRHLYDRQRRGGMGVFDLETPEHDPPACLAIADLDQHLLVVSGQGRAFRLPVSALPESPVHSRGVHLSYFIPLRSEERPALLLPDQGSGYLVVASQRGHLRRYRHHYLGDNLSPGTPLYDVKGFGPPAGACWTSGADNLFIATAGSRAIRFAEKLVPVQGGPGIRLEGDDQVIAIAGVRPESGVFLVSANGLGTIRLMSSFAANKAPGAGGKLAMNAPRLVAALSVQEDEDLFVISRLGKIIRFSAAEVPAKEAAVQGVHCMSLRADEVVAAARSPVAAGS